MAWQRDNRSLVEMARAMIYSNSLPLCLWAEAVATAAYVLNRVPNRKETQVTPYDLWYGRKPDISHLTIFGCRAYSHVLPSQDKSWMRSNKRVILSDMGPQITS